MACDARAVANYLLDEAERQGKHLTTMQLLKLVYFSHGWHLAIEGAPLIDDPVEAWQFGPVIPSVYHEFKKFGNRPIKGRALMLNIPPSGEILDATFEPYRHEFAENQRKILDRVLQVYGDLPGPRLSGITHRQGTPWYEVTRDVDARLRKGIRIPDEMIRDYFVDLAKRNADERRSA